MRRPFQKMGIRSFVISRYIKSIKPKIEDSIGALADSTLPGTYKINFIFLVFQEVETEKFRGYWYHSQQAS